MPHVSFEYFPGRSTEAKNRLEETVKVLAEFQPEFQSVTYGAGGSEKQGTFDAVVSAQATTGIPTASHLTYSGTDRNEIKRFANDLWNAGIKRIVALRGDASAPADTLPFTDTPEFVSALRQYHPFEIAVACYPEVHPRALSADEDIKVLKAKQDAGAAFAITQFFFDNSVFYKFVEKARAAGITIPIIPGVLPIYNFAKVREMAESCGTRIPETVSRAFENGKVCGSDDLEIASELLKAQVHDLACAGFESVHIYTLNRVPLAKLASETFLNAHEENKRQKKVA